MTGTCRCWKRLFVKLLLDGPAQHAVMVEARTLLHAGGAPLNHLRMPGKLAPLVIPARQPETGGVARKAGASATDGLPPRCWLGITPGWEGACRQTAGHCQASSPSSVPCQHQEACLYQSVAPTLSCSPVCLSS